MHITLVILGQDPGPITGAIIGYSSHHHTLAIGAFLLRIRHKLNVAGPILKINSRSNKAWLINDFY
jgi:hypothetical protein